MAELSSDPEPAEDRPEDAELSELRAEARRARRSLDPDARSRAQRSIQRNLLDLAELSGPGRIALYLPTDGEVDVGTLAGELRARDWVVHLPVIRGNDSLAFRRWDADAPLVDNGFGIPEPAGLPGAADSPAKDLDVVVVPCVAVDVDGSRLGFGKGFYDRSLAACGHETALIGVVFTGQLTGSLPRRPWDVPMTIVVTDEGVLRPQAE